MTAVETDLLVIGAGPTGLFAAYYAGFRGLRVAVVDSLPELGGQITAMYPEKAILDVAGFPTIKGRDLVEGLVAQAATADPEYFLDRTALSLKHGGDSVTIGLDDGTEITAGAVLITAGIGKFSPRPLPAGDGWLGKGMEFFVPSFAPYAGKDVVIVGGGDSAFDWALHLEPVAKTVTLVHRRDAFRAHQRTVDAVRESAVEIVTKAEVSALRGNGALEEVDITVDGEVTTRPAQAVVAALGFIADLGPLQTWGIEVQKRHVVVGPSMQTSLERVFAAGDITEYPGKVRLIAVGFGEAATAVNNAAVAIDPQRPRLPRPLQRGLLMAGGREKVKMSDREVADFLAEKVKVQVATAGKDGAPHLTTLFYVVRDGEIAFWTYGRSQKIRNLERDPRITCLVEDGDDYFELRGVSITGKAELVRDPERIFEIGSSVATRMVGASSFEELGDIGRAEVERQAQKRIAVIVHPDHVATWDHSKMV